MLHTKFTAKTLTESVNSLLVSTKETSTNDQRVSLDDESMAFFTLINPQYYCPLESEN